MEQIRYEMRPGEFADAMKSTRAARMLFWLVLAVAIGSQVGSFLLVQFGGVLDRYRAGTVAAERPATAPSEGGAEAASPAPGAPKKPAEAPAKSVPAAARAAAAPPEPASPARALARKWHLGLRWLLPIARFTAAVAGMLLVLTLLFAVQLSLVGRLGGAAGLISAFFWSLILFVMVIPWQQVLTAAAVAPGALFDLEELLSARAALAEDPSWQQQGLYYARFLAYPALTLLVWLVVHAKFTAGCMAMHFPHAVAPAAPVASSPPGDRPAEPAKQGGAAPPAGGSVRVRRTPPAAKTPARPPGPPEPKPPETNQPPDPRAEGHSPPLTAALSLLDKAPSDKEKAD
jgi:hypothetical protein